MFAPANLPHRNSRTDQRQRGLLVRSSGWIWRADDTSQVQHEVPLKVPHVVRHLEQSPAPPLLGIRAQHGTDYPPSTRSFG
jgi:hypothetical protein